MTLRIPLLSLAAIVLLSGCGDDKKQEAPPRTFTDAEFVAQFHRGVNELEQHRFVEAAQTFDELTRSRPNLAAPWINLAGAQLNRNVEGAHALCLAAADRATAIDPKAPQPHFLRGVLFKHLGKFEEAEKNFREALKYAPDDPGTLYWLATIVLYRDTAEATALFEKAIEGETHLQSAYYALSQAKRATDREAVQLLLEMFQAFNETNTGTKMDIVYTVMGRLGDAVRDLPGVESRPAAGQAPKFEFAKEPIPLPGRVLAAVEHDGKLALACSEGSGSDQKIVVRQWTGAAFTATSAEIPGAGAVAPGDFDQDGIEDLAVLSGSGVRLFRSDGKAYQEVTGNPFGGPAPTGFGLTWSDLDQDADLDLVVWGREEARIDVYINKRDGTFEHYDPKPTTTRSGFQQVPLPPAPRGIWQLCPSDLDGDGDPDILVGTDTGFRLWRNDRLMRFTDVTARAGLSDAGLVGAFRVADVDGDRAFDIITNTTVYRQATAGPFRMTFSKNPVKGLGDASPVRIGDLDCDGEDEVIMLPWEKGMETKLAVVSARELLGAGAKPTLIDLPAKPHAVVLADLNCDLALDLVVSSDKPTAPDNTRVYLGKKPAQNHALEIRLAGKVFADSMRANTGGIGARVEVVAGNRSRVREMRSSEGLGAAGPLRLHFGLGTQSNADYVRIVWPDDVLQSEGWVPGDQKKQIEEFQRKSSSCPILFAWNGERFECVTDFLGVGGLGFFIEPGVYGPPDPTEQILIPKLQPRNGKLELRIHEPFEEITYLDAARLIVVDHPAEVDVVPDERFAINAPQPDGKLLAIDQRIDPVAAVDGRKNDVLQEVLKVDRRQAHAVPDRRFLGYAEPTTFEFDFGPGLAGHSGSDRLYLGLEGWVEYPYSHINLAAFQAGIRLEALSVDVEVTGKGFVRIQNEACYPAGMPRIMTLPLGKLPAGLTGRLRLFTNQELWIDRLFLFQPAEPKLTTRTLQASGATLRLGGYPREYSPDGGQPRLYDYDIRDPSFPWKTMAGTYTRFGDVRALLSEPDDCYAIFGGGEEIVLTFDPPPPPEAGSKRTYILDTFGWCKDMDPYTAFPYTVEPLPFRGMSNYPYSADESFPCGERQRAWHREYQTRTLPGTRAR